MKIAYITKNKGLNDCIKEFKEYNDIKNLAIDTKSYYDENLNYFYKFIRKEQALLSHKQRYNI